MIKKRRSSAKAALGQQEAETRRSAPGKRFIGDDADASQARAAERAKVLQMQRTARESAARAEQNREREQEEVQLRDERAYHARQSRRPLWEGVAGLVLESARLAAAVVRLPLRAARVPFRVAAALLPRPRHA